MPLIAVLEGMTEPVAHSTHVCENAGEHHCQTVVVLPDIQCFLLAPDAADDESC